MTGHRNALVFVRLYIQILRMIKKKKKTTCAALQESVILTNVFSKTDLSWKIKKHINRKNNPTRETLSRFILSNFYEETERAILVTAYCSSFFNFCRVKPSLKQPISLTCSQDKDCSPCLH